MARAEAKPASRRDRSQACERAALECEELERAVILGLAMRGVVAARDQDRGLVARRGADLMPVDPGIEFAGLAHRLADGAIAVEAVDGDVARSVVGDEEIFPGCVDAGVDRT